MMTDLNKKQVAAADKLAEALRMTIHFREFTEEWCDMTSPDVMAFMTARDEALADYRRAREGDPSPDAKG